MVIGVRMLLFHNWRRHSLTRLFVTSFPRRLINYAIIDDKVHGRWRITIRWTHNHCKFVGKRGFRFRIEQLSRTITFKSSWDTCSFTLHLLVPNYTVQKMSPSPLHSPIQCWGWYRNMNSYNNLWKSRDSTLHRGDGCMEIEIFQHCLICPNTIESDCSYRWG
jgi:hypothetical protein